jgi:hypothetical protein
MAEELGQGGGGCEGGGGEEGEQVGAEGCCGVRKGKGEQVVEEGMRCRWGGEGVRQRDGEARW